MPTQLKLKIHDQTQLRRELDCLYAQASQKELCQYAMELCSRILLEIKFDENTKDVIQEGITINLLWQQDLARMHDVRQVGFKIHALAKENSDEVQQLGLRVIGQAIATAHMKEHAMVASDYAIKLVNVTFNNDSNKVTQERLWQIDSLRKIIEL